MTPQNKIILPLLTVFVLTNLTLYAVREIVTKWGIDFYVLFFANDIFFLLSLVAFFMQTAIPTFLLEA